MTKKIKKRDRIINRVKSKISEVEYLVHLRIPQVEKSLICNETIEGYLAAIKHLEILFGNSQNDSICGKMAAAPAVE